MDGFDFSISAVIAAIFNVKSSLRSTTIQLVPVTFAIILCTEYEGSNAKAPLSPNARNID